MSFLLKALSVTLHVHSCYSITMQPVRRDLNCKHGLFFRDTSLCQTIRLKLTFAKVKMNECWGVLTDVEKH